MEKTEPETKEKEEPVEPEVKEEEKPVEETPVEPEAKEKEKPVEPIRPPLSNDHKLRLILSLRVPPLHNAQVDEIVEKSHSERPLIQILGDYTPPLADREAIVDEFEALIQKEFTDEHELAKEINIHRTKKGRGQFSSLPLVDASQYRGKEPGPINR